MRASAVFTGLFLAFSAQAAELTLHPVKIAPDVYAIIGDLGAQTYENEGLNSNLGFVVTGDGVLVINTGPGTRIARALHAAIGKITSQPVKWVVNVNSQNHYWLGNGYFKSLGAAIVAHKEADRIMREVGNMQLTSNQRLLKEKADGTTLTYPSELLDDKREIKLGKTVVQLLHFGQAHTPGDIVVWLPQQKIAFTGDIVYTERMLVVLPISHSGNWIQSFDKLAKLYPKIIVPGHGHPADMMTARKDTRDYLAYLRAEIRKSLDKGEMQYDAEERIDQSGFSYLVNFELLARRNAGQIYLEMEKDAF
ncbi:MAG: MBL fold metallo-hydrolase [Gammaproteobacteria bacterium]|nr:MBL fold metallo-hydrolase [Gammaproteobacteria bacterium]